MPQQEFANQKALLAYAERNALVYAWERSPAFAKRQRLLSPKEYEIVEVLTLPPFFIHLELESGGR
jgi:hypothetical protein